MFKQMIQEKGLKELTKHSEILNNQLRSIDESLRALQVAFNTNMGRFDEQLKNIDSRLEHMGAKHDEP